MGSAVSCCARPYHVDLIDFSGITKFRRAAADALFAATASFCLSSLALSLGGKWLTCVLARGALCEDFYYQAACDHSWRARVTSFCVTICGLGTARISRFEILLCQAEPLARG